MDVEEFSTRYARVRELGQGSFARVYLARDAKDGELVAIKESLDVEAAEAMEAEAQVLMALQHPHVMRCKRLLKYTDRDATGQPFEKVVLVLEYVPGTTLDRFVQGHTGQAANFDDALGKQLSAMLKILQSVEQNEVQKPDLLYLFHKTVRERTIIYKQNVELDQLVLTNTVKVHEEVADVLAALGAPVIVKEFHISHYVDAVLYLFDQLLDVLRYLEAKKALHRDLKPENLMVTDNLQLKIIDFGCGKTKRQRKKTASMAGKVGTAGYVSPEVYEATAENLVYTAQNDVWAAVCIFYFMVNGYHAFFQSPHAIQDLQMRCGLFLPPSLVFNGNASQLVSLFQQLLVVDPVQRPTTEKIQQIMLRYTNDREVQTKRVKTMRFAILGAYGAGKSLNMGVLCGSKDHSAIIVKKFTVKKEIIQVKFIDSCCYELGDLANERSIAERLEICFIMYKLGDEEQFKEALRIKKVVDEVNPKCVVVSLPNQFAGSQMVSQHHIEGVDNYTITLENSLISDVFQQALESALATQSFVMQPLEYEPDK